MTKASSPSINLLYLRRPAHHHCCEDSCESELFLGNHIWPGPSFSLESMGPLNPVPNRGAHTSQAKSVTALHQIANECRYLLPRHPDNDETMRVSHVMKTLMHVLQLWGCQEER